MTTVMTGDVRWHMPPHLRSRLLGPAGLPLADWLRDGTATVVKEGPHRAVYRVRLPGLDCHVKHNRLYGLRGRLREMIRPSKGRREFTLAATLQARGILTPRPLAWGTDGGLRPSASWVITETIPDAQTLLAFLEVALPELPAIGQIRVRRRLARSVGTFLAQLHSTGVVHRDLHPGNLLVQFRADGEPRLWLLDLHAVSVGTACSWAARATNLSVFNRYFMLRAGRTDRLRFWRAYTAAAGNADGPPGRQAIAQLERMTQRSNLTFWQSRDARCLHTNRYFVRLDAGVVRGHAVRDLDRGALAPLLADPDAPFRRPDARILKDGRSSTVVEFDLPVGGDVRRVVYKRFRVTDRRDPWLSLVRQSAAVRSWVLGHALRNRELPTPRPLVVWHRLGGGAPREGYLLTEMVEDAVDLHAFVRGLALSTGRPALLRRIHLLARLLRDLHERGLSHRDLKASNILAARGLKDDRLWFIDLVGVRRLRRVGRRRKVRDLARLNASFLDQPLITRSIRLRFLQSYLRVGLHGSGGWKDRWRAIAAATEAKRAKNLRNGRPLA